MKIKKINRHQVPESSDQSDVEMSLPDALGLTSAQKKDESAPPVDHALLESFVKGELTASKRNAVCRLIARFASWHKAWAETLHER
jgi:hypothetical protein